MPATDSTGSCGTRRPGDFAMKVKGIESGSNTFPVSCFLGPGRLAEKASAYAQKTGNQQRRLRSCLVIFLLVTLVMAPMALAEDKEPKTQDVKEQTPRLARKAL